MLGVPDPERPGKTLALPLGVRDREREDKEIDTIAAELRRDRGGNSAPMFRGEDAIARGLARGEWESSVGKKWTR